jgi:hypothetical protein
MGKYSSTTQKESSIRKPKGPHPIWRGIGCLMMLIVPAISIVIGKGIVDFALKNKWRLPVELLGIPQLPDIIYKSSGLKTIFIPLTRIPNLYAYIAASIICILVISSVISFIYAVAYRIANPNRYGPLDEPPPRIKAKKHSR